jgi:8-oxo-dGTP pyrophosphatase MutT (NUDIX family)
MIGAEMFKRYAVFVPLVETDEGVSLLFEKRSSGLRRQPGEICFPGGKLEPKEEPLACAVREATEELLIDKGQITIYGAGDMFVSPFNFIIYPYIGRLDGYHGSFNSDEVGEIFTVPVSYLLSHEPEQYKSTVVGRLPKDFPYERIPGGTKYEWDVGSQDILFYQYGSRLIWGITARLLRSSLQLIQAYQLA